ncbi:anthocyanidin 3-O-glucosyltransferase [Trifolium repens]|nr:anthocyanidin 3-O-glucosyltransferase [Trifolium repens]
MKIQTKDSNTRSEEDKHRDGELFGNINHGGAEHVNYEGGKVSIFFSSSKTIDSLSDIWFLGFKESIKDDSWIGVRGNRTF